MAENETTNATAVAPATAAQSTAMMIAPPANIAEIINENMGGELSANALDRVKVPSGGGTMFMIPTLTGDVAEKRMEGVILFHHNQNAYWPKSIDEGGAGNPPACAALDGKHGAGTPGGICATCPLNAFGSEINSKGEMGSGKACKNVKVLFVLTPGKLLPFAIFAPPTSLKAVNNYFMKLTSAGVPYYGVKTRFTLIEDKNAGGIKYSKLVLELAADATGTAGYQLSAEESAALNSYRTGILPALQNAVVDFAPADVAE